MYKQTQLRFNYCSDNISQRNKNKTSNLSYIEIRLIVSSYSRWLNRDRVYSVHITNHLSFHMKYQGRHGEFEPDKAQYSTQNFFDQLLL